MPIIVFDQWDEDELEEMLSPNGHLQELLNTLNSNHISIHFFTDIARVPPNCLQHRECRSLPDRVAKLAQLFPNYPRNEIIFISKQAVNLGYYHANGFALIDATDFSWHKMNKRGALYDKVASQVNPIAALFYHLNDANFWGPITNSIAKFPKGIRLMQKEKVDAPNLLEKLKRIACARLEKEEEGILFKKKQHDWTRAFYQVILSANDIKGIVNWINRSAYRLQKEVIPNLRLAPLPH